MQEEKKNLGPYIFGLLILVLLVFLFLKLFDGMTKEEKKQLDMYLKEYNMTLEEAEDIGEKQVYKILVQIEEAKSEGRYERGDIIQLHEEEKKFSQAEKDGFLIIKMNLTEKQKELLSRSLEKLDEKEPFSETGELNIETLARRKYRIDLEKIGIGSDDYRGREMETEVFDWKEVIIVKSPK